MEHLLSSFVRVLRKLDDVDDLLAIFQEFENYPLALSTEDRTLSKQDLLKKAALSPRNLTWPEIDVLKNRYWGRVTSEENMVFCTALDKLAQVSEEHSTETFNRLRVFQSRLYNEHEAKAIENVSEEEGRYIDDMQEDEDQTELERMIQEGQLWLQKSWEEYHREKLWDYAIFENPEWKVENPDIWEFYERKSEYSRRMAFSAIVSTIKIESIYLVPSLDWSSKVSTEDESFSVISRELWKQFKYLRLYSLKKNTTEFAFDIGSLQKRFTEGLIEGILQNVFLYLDRNAAESVTKNHFANDFWIWTVDPEYEEDGEDQSGYKGYLYIRLQQFIHNFYIARHWHVNKIAAQKDPYNQLFILLDEEKILDQDLIWEVATAI
ncbi:hypothetical protein VI817_003842 [Penicillium citrinum]|nr:hypothetical protein VI817_003842 [Penicillium citrinum]